MYLRFVGLTEKDGFEGTNLGIPCSFPVHLAEKKCIL